MYRESDQSAVGGSLSGDDRWQDWPPETSSARFEGESAVVSARLAQAPAAKGNHPGVSYYRTPSAPASSTELPAPLGGAGSDGGAHHAKPRGRGTKKIALRPNSKAVLMEFM